MEFSVFVSKIPIRKRSTISLLSDTMGVNIVERKRDVICYSFRSVTLKTNNGAKHENMFL